MCSGEEFIFTWRIENFHMCPHKNCQSITSPVFSAKGFFNTEWCLTLYPRGHSENVIACYLKRKSDEGPEDIEIDFKISIINSASGSTIKHCFRKNSVRFGYSDVFKRSDESKFCVVECHMRMAILKEASAVRNEETDLVIFPSFWKPNSLSPDIFNEFEKATENHFETLRRNIWKCPKQCFARSRVVLETMSVTCPIKNILCLKETEKFYLPVLSCSRTPSLLIILQKTLIDEEENLEAKLSFIDKLIKDVSLSFRIQIEHCEEDDCNVEENIHIFESCLPYEVWRLENIFEIIDLHKHKHMNLNFICSVSDGSMHSNIECSESVDYTSVVSARMLSPKVPSLDMFRFYIEKKFCDVTLRTNEQSFEAHKNVLCAMSPVFDAMFESGMKESSTSNVLINDMDSETISQMLTFLYTGKHEELQFPAVMKLFAAADKYQITLLKESCRNFLKSNMTVENVITVLLLSDMHQDKELKESAGYFVYKNAVYLSQEWKNLTVSNPQLTLDILQDMCCKYF